MEKSYGNNILYHVSIVELILNGNVLASLQHVQILTDMMRANPNIHIKKLELSKHNNMNVEGFALSFEALRHNQTLEVLTITASFRHCDNISSVSLCTRLGDAIQQYLQQTTTLKDLYLFENSFGDIVVTGISKGLQCNASITTFEYCTGLLGNNGAIAIANIGLRYNTCLLNLTLGEK